MPTPTPRSRRLCAALATLLGAAPSAAAQALTYGPILGRGPTPDRMIVKWGSAQDQDPGALFVRPQGSQRPFRQIDGPPGRDHEVWLSGLLPGQSYEYFVTAAAGRSPLASLATCPPADAPLTVVFYGDSRSNPAAHASVVSQVQAQQPDMVLESGDIAPLGQYAEYLSEFAPVTAALTAHTPFMAAPGNHDLLGPLSAGYARVFPTPRPGPDAPWRPYYAFTCGPALFIALDSNFPFDEDQIAFLRQTLAQTRQRPELRHVLVWFHHPPYSPGLHGDNQGIIDLWARYFQDPRNRISAVFSGHDHLYARMSDGSATAYVVSGGAGAELYSDQGRSQARRLASAVSLNLVRVALDGPLLRLTALDDHGAVLDQFTVNRDAVPPSSAADSLTSDPLALSAHGCAAAPGAPAPARPAALLLLATLGLCRTRQSKRRRALLIRQRHRP